MKVAYYSPMPPERSGIADYSALLVPALRERLDVEVAPHGKDARGDVRLYHMGNDPAVHGWILEELRRRPGVVVLHDFVLHHLVAGLTLGRKDSAGYLAAMERDAGIAGRLLGLGVIDGCVPPLWVARPEDFPLSGEVLESATSLIVHSHYVEQCARGRGYEGPIWRVPMPAWPAPAVERADVGGSPVFGAFGHMNAAKRLPQLLRAFARFREKHAEARLLLVGSVAPELDLDLRIDHARLGDAIVRHDFVSETRLWSLLARVDGVVSLRSPTMGETSAMVIRALTLGKPVIVSDVGWFSELPDDVALKVAPDEREVDRLVAALTMLARSDVGEAMGAKARALASSEHDIERVADLYSAALRSGTGRVSA